VSRFSARQNSVVSLWGVFDGDDGLCVPGLFTRDPGEAEELAGACNRLDGIGMAPSTRRLYDDRHDERMAWAAVAHYEAGLRAAVRQWHGIRRGDARRAIAENIPADLRVMDGGQLAAEQRLLAAELGADGATAIEAWEAAYELPCPDRETADRRSDVIRRWAAVDAELARRAETGDAEQPALFGAGL